MLRNVMEILDAYWNSIWFILHKLNKTEDAPEKIQNPYKPDTWKII